MQKVLYHELVLVDLVIVIKGHGDENFNCFLLCYFVDVRQLFWAHRKLSHAEHLCHVELQGLLHCTDVLDLSQRHHCVLQTRNIPAADRLYINPSEITQSCQETVCSNVCSFVHSPRIIGSQNRLTTVINLFSLRDFIKAPTCSSDCTASSDCFWLCIVVDVAAEGVCLLKELWLQLFLGQLLHFPHVLCTSRPGEHKALPHRKEMAQTAAGQVILHSLRWAT